MTKQLKEEIADLIRSQVNIDFVGPLVEDIASLVDREFAKAVTETCELGPMLEAVGLEIRSKDNA